MSPFGGGEACGVLLLPTEAAQRAKHTGICAERAARPEGMPWRVGPRSLHELGVGDVLLPGWNPRDTVVWAPGRKGCFSQLPTLNVV